MKKIVLAIVLLFACLLLVGCGEKTQVLSCSTTSYASGIKYWDTEDLTFKGKKVTDLKLTLKFDLSNLAGNQTAFDQAVEALRLEYSKAIEKGVTTNVYPEGNYVIAVFTFNPELFDGFLDYMQMSFSPYFSNQSTLEQIQEEFESKNYTCSVK